jgi:hypothetical protein
MVDQSRPAHLEHLPPEHVRNCILGSIHGENQDFASLVLKTFPKRITPRGNRNQGCLAQITWNAYRFSDESHDDLAF